MANIVVSDEEEDLEDPSKQRRKIAEIDQHSDISLAQHDAEVQGRHEHDMESDFEFTAAEEVYNAEKEVSTVEPVSIIGAAVTTASEAISTASPTRRVSTTDDITMAETLVYIKRSATIDKAAVRLQKQLDEEERQRIALVQESTNYLNIEKWENIQARVEADEELAHMLQAEEREKYFEAEKARLLAELINQRKKYFAA
ncbi:hypothetical protein Tco_1557897, partial [Tanacetum coccineum]